MKKKKSLYKYIKRELVELNTILDEIDRLDDNKFKKISLNRVRTNIFNNDIKPLMLIYQASKNN
tara:strand:- start:260 stop:451 length:192 start_codon:yes stop_codon:yes gene_type:complete